METLSVDTLTPEAVAAPPEPRRRFGVARVRTVAIAFAAACVVGALLYLGTWPPLAVVESGSMAPTIKTGDAVVLKRLDGPPRVGDIVAVTVPDAARARFGYPPEVTHRVVRIAPNGAITTKGDALKAPDPFTVRSSAVSAKVVATIPAAGRALAFLTSTLGLIWLAAGALLLVALPMIERRRDAEAHEQETIAAVHNRLESVADEVVGLRADLAQALERAPGPAEYALPAPGPAEYALPAPGPTDPVPPAPGPGEHAPPPPGPGEHAPPPPGPTDPVPSAPGATEFAPPMAGRPAWDDRAELAAWNLTPPAPVAERSWTLAPPVWDGDCPQPTRRARGVPQLTQWNEDFADAFPDPGEPSAPERDEPAAAEPGGFAGSEAARVPAEAAHAETCEGAGVATTVVRRRSGGLLGSLRRAQVSRARSID